ncbi:hypothetical protein U2718_005405 [Chlorogloeopsis sp. ULAP02]
MSAAKHPANLHCIRKVNTVMDTFIHTSEIGWRSRNLITASVAFPIVVQETKVFNKSRDADYEPNNTEYIWLWND